MRQYRYTRQVARRVAEVRTEQERYTDGARVYSRALGSSSIGRRGEELRICKNGNGEMVVGQYASAAEGMPGRG